MKDEIATFEGVTVKYGKVLAVDNVSLTLKGDRILVIGPNGSGKSTLIKVMLGLIRASKGRVRVFGLDPLKHRPQIYARTTYLGEKDGIPHSIKVRTHLEHLETQYGPTVWKTAETLELREHINKRFYELS